MAQELAFVIPGIYISKASKNSLNEETPKEFIRVLGESDTKENYFKIDDGRELPEYVILTEYELYSIGYSENDLKSSINKSKSLMKGFEPTQKPDNTEQQSQTKNVSLPENTKIVFHKEENNHSIIASDNNILSIVVPFKLTDFEEAVLKQFCGKIEETIEIPSIIFSCNVNFPKLANAIEMFGLNRKNIARNIAQSFINNIVFYESLSDVLEKMLDIKIIKEQDTKEENILVESSEHQQNTDIFEKENSKPNTEEEEVKNSSENLDSKEIEEKRNSIDEYLKSHGLI